MVLFVSEEEGFTNILPFQQSYDDAISLRNEVE